MKNICSSEMTPVVCNDYPQPTFDVSPTAVKIILDKQQQMHEFFMTCAVAAAKLSKAQRKKVGAVLAKDGRIISTGYNGQPSGFDNCCEYVAEDGSLKTKPTVIHAEMNAILFCAKYGITTEDTVLYITLSPCNNCVTSIIQSGIKHVYYLEEYRDTSGVDFLRQAGIPVDQIKL
jgi:dCMP deaminase